MILVDIIRKDLALVIERPGLLERWLLHKRESERFAVRIPTPGGHTAWHWDVGGARCSRGVELAIERAVVSAEWQRVLAQCGGGNG